MILTQIDRVIIDQYTGNLGEAFAHYFRHEKELLQSPVGRYEAGGHFFYMVQEYDSKDPAGVLWESHQKYIDIQIVCGGEEVMEFSDISFLQKTEENPEKDLIRWEGSAAGSMIFRKGGTAVFYPEDAHRPGLWFKGSPAPIRKIVYKVLLD